MSRLSNNIPLYEQQEKELQFTRFNHEDAWKLGCMLVEEARRRGVRPAFQITVNGYIIFRYGFDGTNLHNEMWLRRKTNTVAVTQLSSLHVGALLEASGEDIEADWFLPAMDYAILGGGFPITLRGTGTIGCVCCSGLPHETDHEIVTSTIAEFLRLQHNTLIQEAPDEQ